MRNKIIKGLAGIFAAGALLLIEENTAEQNDRKTTVPAITVNHGVTNTLNVPIYDLNKVPANFCARYVRLAAKDLFEKTYSTNNAWDYRYAEDIISRLDTNKLEVLVKKQIIEPGMMIGIHNPKSLYNLRTDKKGRSVEYTHVGLFIGLSTNGEALIAHEYGEKTEVVTANELIKRGLSFKEIIAPKQN